MGRERRINVPNHTEREHVPGAPPRCESEVANHIVCICNAINQRINTANWIALADILVNTAFLTMSNYLRTTRNGSPGKRWNTLLPLLTDCQKYYHPSVFVTESPTHVGFCYCVTWVEPIPFPITFSIFSFNRRKTGFCGKILSCPGPLNLASSLSNPATQCWNKKTLRGP